MNRCSRNDASSKISDGKMNLRIGLVMWNGEINQLSESMSLVSGWQTPSR